MNPYNSLVLVVGRAGSGKSTVARNLAKSIGASYLDKDSVNDFTGALLELHGEAPGARDESTYYTTSIRPLEYQTILKMASQNLVLGNNVVIDAPFGFCFGDGNYITEVRRKFDWPDTTTVYCVRVFASESLTKERILERACARDEWKIEHWSEFWDRTNGSSPNWLGVSHVDFENRFSMTDSRFEQSIDHLASTVTTGASTHST